MTAFEGLLALTWELAGLIDPSYEINEKHPHSNDLQ
jgi:hypothetical protein